MEVKGLKFSADVLDANGGETRRTRSAGGIGGRSAANSSDIDRIVRIVDACAAHAAYDSPLSLARSRRHAEGQLLRLRRGSRTR